MNIKKNTVYALSLLVLIHYQANAEIVIPPGFEEIAKGSDIFLSVSVYGKSLGMFKVRVDLEKITFLDEKSLEKALEKEFGSSDEFIKTIRQNLKKPLDRNSILSCSSRNVIGCDYIKTDSVAAIYDENNSTVSLFFSDKFSFLKPEKSIYYNATEDVNNAFIHQQSVNFVTGKDSQSLSLRGNGTLGISQNTYMVSDWNWNVQKWKSSSYNKAYVNNISLRHDIWKRLYIQTGLMDPSGLYSSTNSFSFNQLPLKKIVGLRAGTTMDWINKKSIRNGTPVTVLIGRDSRVDIFRKEQLISSVYLTAGPQQLETSSFPVGSYMLTLRIYEDNKLVRTEQVPFTSLSDAPVNSFQWFVQTGKIVSETETINDNLRDKRVAAAGIKVPLILNSNLTFGSVISDNLRSYEGAIDWTHGFNSGPIDGVLYIRNGYSANNVGDRGNTQQISYNDGFTLNLYRTSTRAASCDSGRISSYSSGCYTSLTSMLAIPIAQWTTTIGYTIDKNESRFVQRNTLSKDDSLRETGAPWEWVYRTRSRNKTVQLGFNRNFILSGMSINTSFNFFNRKDSDFNRSDRGGFFTVNLSFSGQSDNGARHYSASTNANYRHSSNQRDQLSYGASYNEYLQNDTGSRGLSVTGAGSDNISLSAYKNIQSQYGDGSLTVSDSYQKEDRSHLFSTSGSYNSAFAVDSHGIYIGEWNGSGGGAGGVVIDVDANNDKEANVDASINSGKHTQIAGNSHGLFTVNPYQKTSVEVNESGNTRHGVVAELTRGAGLGTIFMTPGRIYRKKVSVKSRYTWYGRMLTSEHKPIEDAVPINVASWSPLDKGAFILETEQPVKQVYVMSGNNFLRCPLNVKKIKDVIRWVGDSNCENVSFSALPANESRQVELMTVKSNENDNNMAMR